MKGLFYLFLGLGIIITIMYYAVRYLRIEKEQMLAELMVKDSTEKVQNPVTINDSMYVTLQNFKQELTGKTMQLDSLQKIVKEKEQIVEQSKALAEKLSGSKKQDNLKTEKARTMAKTFEKMNVKEIGPILKNLDDKTVILIYAETSNRFKKNILLAVNEKRAAMITKQFINRN